MQQLHLIIDFCCCKSKLLYANNNSKMESLSIQLNQNCHILPIYPFSIEEESISLLVYVLFVYSLHFINDYHEN